MISIPASVSSYTALTASMRTDTAARPCRGEAVVPSPRAFPIQRARCATVPSAMEWVPDREERVVPGVMSALCRPCPGRQACLLWALTGQEQGYWAGTTGTDRQLMRHLGRTDLPTADWLQGLARQEFTTGPALHPPGEGSYWWYRRHGCRCTECKRANAQTRAAERAKARERAA